MILEATSPERRLAAAILKRAVLDARAGNGQAAVARRWLLGDEARILWDGLGILSTSSRGGSTS
jgi:hypothetical protein